MPMFKVRKFHKETDGDIPAYIDVEAATAKDAAEKFYGKPLLEVGKPGRARVLVEQPIRIRVQRNIIFYEG